MRFQNILALDCSSFKKDLKPCLIFLKTIFVLTDFEYKHYKLQAALVVIVNDCKHVPTSVACKRVRIYSNISNYFILFID